MTTRHLHTAARGLVAMLVAAAVSSGIGTPGAAPMAADVDGLAFAEEAAIRAAVDRVARSVVRIESAGVSATGLASAGEATPATGPSTGLVVEEGGWVHDQPTHRVVAHQPGEAVEVALRRALRHRDARAAERRGLAEVQVGHEQRA